MKVARGTLLLIALGLASVLGILLWPVFRLLRERDPPED